MSDIQKKREAYERARLAWDAGHGVMETEWHKLSTELSRSARALLAALEAEPKPGRSVEERTEDALRLMLDTERAAHEELRRRVERALATLGPPHNTFVISDAGTPAPSGCSCHQCRAIRILEGREP